MSGTEAERIHIETVVGLFKILDLEVIDAETIVATYEVPPSLASNALEYGERLGVFGKVRGGGYELTPRGKRKLSDLTLRGGNRPRETFQSPGDGVGDAHGHDTKTADE